MNFAAINKELLDAHITESMSLINKVSIEGVELSTYTDEVSGKSVTVIDGSGSQVIVGLLLT